MSSKVKCTCGWSWNKSDSSKKDMYMCHECGANNAPAKQEEVEKAQNGWMDKISSTLNPNNWGVDDYSSSKNFNTAYSSAKKKGEEEFMFKNKRYNTKYAGTPRQEVGSYGIKGKAVNPDDIDNPAMVTTYPKLGQYLPGHMSASADSFNDTSVDFGPKGNYLNGINVAKKNKGEETDYVYGADRYAFGKKAEKLPLSNSAEYTKEEIKEWNKGKKEWNLITNNCADNVCDAFGIPRSKGIETPPAALEKIKKKYPTLDVTGRTKEDYLQRMKNMEKQTPYEILSNAKETLGIASSPEFKGNVGDTGSYMVYNVQDALSSQGYDIDTDSVDGPKTRAALDHWESKKNRNTKGLLAKKEFGGEIPKAQTGKKVKYNTPEYREEYNKGEVLSSTGERSPIALDEVTVQNDYKRPRNWLEQYADKIVDENKDAGVLGSIFGTPISAVTSLPQMFATKSITGEMQRPSEAMNIENPYGSMAVDAVLDPVNLAGAGLLTKENLLSGLGKIRTGINPELIQGLQSQGMGNIMKDVKSFTNNKFIPGSKTRNLPETLVPHIEYNPNSSTHTRINLNDPKGTSFGYLGLENKSNWIKDDIGQFTYNNSGFPIKGEPEWVSPSMISVSPKLQGNQTQDLLYQLGIEEAKKRGMKGVYSGETLLSPEKTKKAHERFNREIFGQKVARATDEREAVNHDIVGLTGHTNPNVVNDWLENYKNIDKFSRNHYSINDVASAPFNYVKNNPKDAFAMGLGSSTVGGIGWAFTKLDDLEKIRAKEFEKEWEESKKKNNKKEYGGVIKDDRGQWDHPGEITEISGDTMATHGYGDIPLYVVPDVGEPRVVQANTGTQKFPGAKKFTEYPMARNGKKSGGWLDQLN